MTTLRPLFSWRSAICDSDLTATQRHVALTLSLHMSERGDSCFPSVMTLVAETALSERAIRAALKDLREAGWLTGEKRWRADGSESSTSYTATTPPAPDAGGGATPAPPGAREGEGGGAPGAPQEDVQYEDVKEDASDLLPAVVETTPPAKVGRVVRDAVFTALATGCGYELTEMSTDAKKVTALAANDLVAMGITDTGEIRQRCMAYRLKFPNAACTPKAVVKHWPGLRPELVEAEQEHRTRMAKPRDESPTDRLARIRAEGASR
jgi:hypothetical protein